MADLEPEPIRVGVGLGSNVGDKKAHIETALDLLGGLQGVDMIAGSRLYRTAPVGYLNQDWFVNAACVLETRLPARALLQRFLEVEARMGRKREIKWGPRIIDIDLLYYGDRFIHEPGLIAPHPLMAERRFVLVPLAEVAPDWVHPAAGLTAAQMLGRLPAGEQEVVLL